MTDRPLLACLAVVALLATGCSGGSSEQDPPAAASSITPDAEVTPEAPPPPTATEAPRPRAGACHQLTFDEAIAPTADLGAVPCVRRHTAETYGVGTVAAVADGHLLAIDSERVQGQVASSCPAGLSAYVGGTQEELRLSMLRPVWFTPTVEASDSGADWYRCDVVALAGSEALTQIRGSLKGVLDTPQGRDTYGMCGTAKPDDRRFQRVPCAEPHSWRAFSVVALPGGDYPGRSAIAAAGETPCRDAAAEIADDPLDYEWGFEGPDPEQWEAGQTFIRCWAPD